MLTDTTRGVYVIAATPFAADGALDLTSTDRLVDFYLSCGAHGITILGMMGEASQLTAEESVAFATRVLKRVEGRVPVVVGVSHPALRLLTDLTSRVMDLGAAGIMVAPPPGLRTDEQIYAYVERVLRAIGPRVPVCLQDHPQSTGVFLSAGLVVRLVADFAQIVIFKHEDCPGLKKLSRIRADSQQAGVRRVSILAGNGGLYFPQELRRGADGAMTGFAFPEMLVEVYKRFERGDAEGAEDLFDAYLPIVRHEQQPGFGLAIRKAVLFRRGVIDSFVTRAPAPSLDAVDLRELDELVARLARRLGRPIEQVWRPA